MSKFKGLILFLAFIAIPLQGKSEEICCDYICDDDDDDSCWGDTYYFTLEGRASAYFPFEKRVRKIYSSTLGLFEGEIDVPIWNGWTAYFSAGYIKNEGKSIGLRDKTSLQMVPLTWGVKYFCKLSCVDVFFGAGLVYSLLHIHDHSRHIERHISKNALGGTVSLGAQFFFTEDWFIDTSVEYLYQRFSFKNTHSDEHYIERHDLDMSGIKLGAGIGFTF